MTDPQAIREDADRVARIALAEDGGRDITTEVTVPPQAMALGRIECRAPAVLAGVAWTDAIVRGCDLPPIAWSANEGDRLSTGEVPGMLRGDFVRLLRAERPMLNLLQRASGIATATRAFVDRVAGTRATILHTRKTTPGLRLLEVQAVIAGGGAVHRLDLSHTVMVKDNHWRVLEQSGRTLAEALNRARAVGVTACYVEVESPAQVELACAAGATRLLIDNQAPETVRKWGTVARHLRPGIEIEATGGITLENVRAYAEAGSDFISIGALTHSARAADIALELAASA